MKSSDWKYLDININNGSIKMIASFVCKDLITNKKRYCLEIKYYNDPSATSHSLSHIFEFESKKRCIEVYNKLSCDLNK